MKIKKANSFVELLAEIDSVQGPFGFLAGGTDVMPGATRGILEKETVFDLSPFAKELHFIRETGDSVEIGALVSLAEIAENKIISSNLPQLATAIRSIGSRQIRNMGTLSGNIANASPIADTAPVLLTKDAKVNSVSASGQREIAIEDFFVDYKKTALKSNEVIKSVSIPFNRPLGKYGFYKIAIRPEMAVSKVNLAYSMENGNLKLAAGGATKYPVRLKNVEEVWKSDLSNEELDLALGADVTPISDLRSTAEYRKRVLFNLIVKLFRSFRE